MSILRKTDMQIYRDFRALASRRIDAQKTPKTDKQQKSRHTAAFNSFSHNPTGLGKFNRFHNHPIGGTDSFLLNGAYNTTIPRQ